MRGQRHHDAVNLTGDSPLTRSFANDQPQGDHSLPLHPGHRTLNASGEDARENENTASTVPAGFQPRSAADRLQSGVGRRPGGAFAFAKRAIDIAGSAALLLAFAPVMVFLAAVIKLTYRGPVFLVQECEGRGGRPFSTIRFRTTRARAHAPSQGGHGAAGGREPDLLRISEFLRNAGLDELPQLFNVLIGNMSLVGPRPRPLGRWRGMPYSREMMSCYHLRYEVRPGLTGLAQVSGLDRQELSAKAVAESIRYDVEYVQNACLKLDFRIIWQALRQEFTTKNNPGSW